MFVSKHLSLRLPGRPAVKTSLSNVRGADSVSGWGAEIPRLMAEKTETKQKEYCNKFNKDF